MEAKWRRNRGRVADAGVDVGAEGVEVVGLFCEVATTRPSAYLAIPLSSKGPTPRRWREDWERDRSMVCVLRSRECDYKGEGNARGRCNMGSRLLVVVILFSQRVLQG